MSNENNNNGLYFLVGGLLVAVLVIGGLYLTQTETGEKTIEKTTTVIDKTTQDDNQSGSSFDFEVSEDGFSASSQTQE